MADKLSLGSRWENYRPTKGSLVWACMGCIVATMAVGFTWGGWVTGGTATSMASAASSSARAELAAAACVSRFNSGPDAVAQLTALKNASSYQRGDILQKNGWATLPGNKIPIEGASDLCAQKLITAARPPAEDTTRQATKG